jgi:hypothetical protein
MTAMINIKVAGVRAVRSGSDYFWSKLLEASRDGGSMSLVELRGVCDPGHAGAVTSFMKRMLDAGYVERSGEKPPYRFRIVKPQRDYPLVTADGRPSLQGRSQQQMWNVMRRERLGFTIDQLVIDGSTDEVRVTDAAASSYVGLLVRAGVVKITREGKTQKERWYVLTGTGNTGPKAPRRMRSTFMYDPNSSTVLGDLLAQEDRS